MGDLLHVFAHHKTLWLLQTLWATAFIAAKIQGVKCLEEVFWGVRQCVQASKRREREVLVQRKKWPWFGERSASE
jgi:hypothetical protein